MQVPGSVIVVGQCDSGILGDDFVMDGQNGLCVHTHPRQLQNNKRTEINTVCVKDDFVKTNIKLSTLCFNSSGQKRLKAGVFSLQPTK